MRRAAVVAVLLCGCSGVAPELDAGRAGGTSGGSSGGSSGGVSGGSAGGATSGGSSGGVAGGSGGGVAGGASGGSSGGVAGGSGGGVAGGASGGSSGGVAGGSSGGSAGGASGGLAGGSASDGGVRGFSLRFFGTQRDDVDRVKVRSDLGPVNVAGDFTFEAWLKATGSDNPLDACGSGGAGWINGNIFADRDIYGSGDRGDWGLSLNRGRVAFGVEVGSSGATLCGATSLTDGGWHHVAVTRRASDGRQQLWVDGRLDGTVLGAGGDVSYRTGRATTYPQSDPFLVFGAEKHDAVPPGVGGYSGLLDEVRLSRVVRYDGGFARPSAPFTTDPDTVLLLHFDEGQGATAFDQSASQAHGVLRDGGSPAGPRWTGDSPF
jgi:hypothetical protein